MGEWALLGNLIVIFSIEEQDKILAAGRSNNFLDTSKLVEMYPNVKNIKESVRLCLENMSKL